MAGDSTSPQEIVEKGVRENVRDVVKYELGRMIMREFDELDEWLIEKSREVVKECGRLPLDDAEKCTDEQMRDIKKELKDRFRVYLERMYSSHWRVL